MGCHSTVCVTDHAMPVMDPNPQLYPAIKRAPQPDLRVSTASLPPTQQEFDQVVAEIEAAAKAQEEGSLWFLLKNTWRVLLLGLAVLCAFALCVYLLNRPRPPSEKELRIQAEIDASMAWANKMAPWKNRALEARWTEGEANGYTRSAINSIRKLVTIARQRGVDVTVGQVTADLDYESLIDLSIDMTRLLQDPQKFGEEIDSYVLLWEIDYGKTTGPDK